MTGCLLACLSSGTPSSHRRQTEGDDEVVQVSDEDSGSQDPNVKRPRTSKTRLGEQLFSCCMLKINVVKRERNNASPLYKLASIPFRQSSS